MKKRESKVCECGRQFESRDYQCESCTHLKYIAVWERQVYAPPTMRQSISGLIYGCLILALCIKPVMASEATIYGKASWYSVEACKFNPSPKCPTASGDSLYALEKKKEDFCAMWKLPIGSRVNVCNQSNNKCVEVSVLDRGPARRLDRLIDLSRSAFEKIADTKSGIIRVSVEVLK